MKLFVLAFVLVLSAAADSLPPQSYSTSASTGCPGIPVCDNDFSFDVQQFNASLGTLLSVDFTFSDTETVDLAAFGFGTAGLLTVESSASSSLLGLTASSSSQYPVVPPCNPAPCQVVATNGLSSSGTTFSDAFIGTGTVSVPFDNSGEAAGFTGSGAFSFDINQMSDSASLTITYTYTPVPEPRMLLVLAIAAGVLLLVRPRNSRTNNSRV